MELIAENMQVKDVMTRGVVTVPMESNAVEIAKAMADNSVSAIVAIEDNGETFGVISDVDILRKMKDKNWEIASVEDIMSDSVETINPSATVHDAAELMAAKKVHRLIVMSEETVGASYRPIGILSARDIIKQLFQK
ncbi:MULTISPECIES: cyclic nucleotide-binding/CBS domain-containing protein [Methanococcoides]|uniref:Inosine-5'-monophosphate dehydrogenase n=2 Tax=Methanococcoides TaxID=2225 RepID=A0A0E3SNM8_METMT|nr:CBS domain-containing protein [Methanococcoides methylutens]AKB84166.1 Inosine-5'-monophosphate dehydrogenase [Methanococcoides methylutens MM1]